MKIYSRLLFGVLLGIYLIVGLQHSAKQGFWHDEIYTLTFMKGVSIYNFEGSIWSDEFGRYTADYFKGALSEDNFYTNFSTQILHEGHPPLYFVLLKVWTYAFGTTEVALRSFSLVCGILASLVLFLLVERKSKHRYTAWVVLVTVLFNPFLFYFFTEARMYALAFFFAVLTFKHWLDYQEEGGLKKSRTFLWFSLSSVALLYTHYYGLFFLSSLAFLELLRVGLKPRLFNYAIPVALFLPWGFAIDKQLAYHVVHWTDGAISFGDSLFGYLDGTIHLLISPMVAPTLSERLVLYPLLAIMVVILLIKEQQFTLTLLATLLVYGLQVYVFDQILDHHTILVPRYYVFSMVFIYWGIYKFVDTIQWIPAVLIPSIYALLSATVLLQIYQLERAPKQMFREVASYIDGQIDAGTRPLVFEPQGPLMVGVAYYLQNNFSMVAAGRTPAPADSTPVYIDERLGVAYREDQYHVAEQKQMEFIPFVGVFLYK